MNMINDPVFGELRIDKFNMPYRREEFSLFGRKYMVELSLDAYIDNGGISDVQRKAYKEYIETKNEKEMLLPDILLKYCKENYDEFPEYTDIPKEINDGNINQQNVTRLIKVTHICFGMNGKYGFLCDCAWDLEGISIVLSGDKPFVTDQNYLC